MSDRQLILSPRELYCMGGVLNAKYIDYAYIAALDDIGQDFELFRKETLSSLTAKGVIEEDFGGDMETNEAYITLLEPIFFGSVETSLDVCTIGDEVTVDVYKFHFYQDRITMVKAQMDDLLIETVTFDEMNEIVTALVPKGYAAASGEKITSVDNEKVTRFFAAKNINIGVISNVQTFIEADGVLCTEKAEGTLESLSGADFVSAVFEIIKGAL